MDIGKILDIVVCILNLICVFMNYKVWRSVKKMERIYIEYKEMERYLSASETAINSVQSL